MTAPITSARVRELSAKATGGRWHTSPLDQEVQIYTEDFSYIGETRDRTGDDAALIAALCSEPARNRIAKALDLLERVEAGDAGLVAWLSDPRTADEAMACTMARNRSDVHAVCRWLARVVKSGQHWRGE